MFILGFSKSGVGVAIIAFQIINVILSLGLSAADINDNKLAGWSFDNDTPQELQATGVLKLNLKAIHKNGPSPIFDSGIKGKALFLPPKHSCQFISTKPLELQPPYTICFWLKPTESQHSDIIGNKADSTKDGFRVRFINGKLRFDWGNGDQTYTVITDESCIPIAEWTFIAITDDDDYISIIINGVMVQKFKKEGNITNSTRPLIIMNYGVNPNAFPFIGGLDELCFFNRVLTIDELKTLTKQ